MLLYVHISSIEAALLKLNIPSEDILKAVEEEEEARHVKEQRELQAQFEYVAKHPPSLNPVAKRVTNDPANVDPRVRESRRRLLELTQEAFPDGKVPDRYRPYY